MIRIEKGVPLPSLGSIGRRELVAALKKMKVGESFVYSGPTRNPVYVAAKIAGVRVTARIVDGSEGIWRVWRRD